MRTQILLCLVELQAKKPLSRVLFVPSKSGLSVAFLLLKKGILLIYLSPLPDHESVMDFAKFQNLLP